MRRHRRAAICLLTAACTVACRRNSGPDANYQQASALYQQLYVTELDDAYGDPQMDQVVALLKKVKPSSEDAAAAKGMLGAIQHGREELAKQRAEREKFAKAAEAAAAAPLPDIDPQKVLAAYAVDAGPAAQDPYGSGALVSDINAQTGGCLTDHEPFNEQGTGVSGKVYRIVQGPACAAKLPGYVGQAVLVVNGRIYRRVADPNPPQPPGAARTAPSADAGAPEAAAPPARPPAPRPPVDAGEPQYQIVIPGAPQPSAATPDAGLQ